MTKGKGRRLADWLGPAVALLAMGVAASLASPHFLTPGNLTTVAVQVSAVAILAVAQTIVIISGGIDLSVGAVLALAGVVAALMMKAGLPIALACGAGLLVGVACGAANGALTALGRMPPFIVTLGMMGMARGAALIITGGTNVFGIPPSFANFATTSWLGLPLPALLAFALAAGTQAMLSRTRLGRHTYAIGGNAEAARLSGVPISRTIIALYALSGLLSAVAGLVLTSRLSIGQPTAGQGYELDAVAAAVIGGASLMGGQGSIIGTILGAGVMGLLRNGCDLLGVESFWQQVAIGAIIIAAVLLDQVRRRK